MNAITVGRIFHEVEDLLDRDRDYIYLLGLTAKSAKSFPWSGKSPYLLGEYLMRLMSNAEEGDSPAECASLIVRDMVSIAALDSAVALWMDKGVKLDTARAPSLGVAKCELTSSEDPAAMVYLSAGGQRPAVVSFAICIDASEGVRPDPADLLNGRVFFTGYHKMPGSPLEKWVESDWFPIRDLTLGKVRDFAKELV